MMSEPNMEQKPQGPAEVAAADDEEISWEDALEDLERQKQMIREQQKQSPAARPAAPHLAHAAKPTPQAERSEAPQNLQFILDIPLQVTVELGRKRLLVHDLLQLSQGSVIELTKQIGEPFEVLVNQKLIARGEVVVINDKFGVRITDIISPLERVQQL
jgi:flagellar motor switch protein FliN/FliY